MIYFASEMKRQNFKIPLLIGGATTSKAHTAIKIAPHYDEPVVQVGDASLVVEVCSDLLSPNKKSLFAQNLLEQQQKIRERYRAGLEQKSSLIEYKNACEQRFQCDWSKTDIAKPSRFGVFTIEFSIEELIDYIDWSPFFWTWELKGSYPKILNHEKFGIEAKKLFSDAQALLKLVISQKNFTAKSIVGIFKAQSFGDDVCLSLNETQTTLHFLRQQKIKSNEEDSLFCLSDFISPNVDHDSMGLFAVSIDGVESLAMSYEQKHDDYNAIMVKALGDRLAEALAEATHKKVRDIYGFGLDENLSYSELIKESYRGIRPAPGYPACPDHTEKQTLWKLLDVESKIGISLTESFAMNPPASVCGYIFNHPNAQYFNVGLMGLDQIESYAQRKKMSVVECEKWLSSNLSYERN